MTIDFLCKIKKYCFNIKKVVCCFLMFFGIVFEVTLNSTQTINEIINTMPREDKRSLEKLFYRMFNFENMAYTLFGDKPVSMCSEFILTPIEESTRYCGGCFWKRWEIWKKYENNFPMTRYLLLENKRSDKSNNIILINKKAFLKIVNQYLTVFRKILGKNVTAKSLLKTIEENQQFDSVIKNNQMLKGILLGYGVHNSKLFAERHKLRQFLEPGRFVKIPLKIPNPSEGFDSLSAEFNSYFSVLKHFGDCGYSPVIINSVHFVADPNHPETIKLREKYRELRGEISAIYSKGDFLEITLSKLTSD